MNEVIAFGDLHLSDERPWNAAVGKEILNYIRTCPYNTEENVGLFLGDLTEHVRVDGQTYNLLLEILDSLKFKKTYIVRGNHDFKKKKYRNDLTSPLRVLEEGTRFPNIKLITEMTVIEECDLKILALPYIMPSEKHSLKDYESFTPLVADVEYDIIAGHFADTSSSATRGESIDISYLKATYRCMGHIHNPISTSYIGALVPNATSEANQLRGIRVYWKGACGYAEQRSEKLKTPLADYYEVRYPDPLPKTKALVPIWTIANCRDEAVARAQYGEDIFIRACTYDVTIDFTQFQRYTGAVATSTQSKKELIEEFLGESKEKLSENVQKLVRSYAN
jgi:calcineurin-like phosphoesterase family protein